METHGYGYYIHWNNGKDSISVTGCATPQEAYERAIAFATDSGWTRPKWWQFWRWSDSNPKPHCTTDNLTGDRG